jgi:hypothetical protein
MKNPANTFEHAINSVTGTTLKQSGSEPDFPGAGAAAQQRAMDALKALSTANAALSQLTAMAENLEADGVLPWGRVNARTAYLLNTDVQQIMSRLKKFQQVLGAAVSATEEREHWRRLRVTGLV